MGTRITTKKGKCFYKTAVKILLCVLLACVLEYVQIETQPQYQIYSYSLPDEGNQVYPQQNTTCQHAVFEGNWFKPIDEDPYFFIDTVDAGEMQSIVITFSETITESYAYRVFYRPIGGEFTEENSVWGYAHNGYTNAGVTIPMGSYQMLRFDFNGAVPIEAIRCSSQPLNIALDHMKDTMHWDRVLFAAVLLLAVAWLCSSLQVMDGCKRLAAYLRKNWKRTAIEMAAGVLAAGVMSVVLYHLLLSVGYGATAELKAFCVVAAAACIAVWICRRVISDKPEWIFALIALAVGGLFVFYLPVLEGNSWDEAYHFRRALETSYFNEYRVTQVDEDLDMALVGRDFDDSVKENPNPVLDPIFDAGAVRIQKNSYNPEMVWAFMSGALMYLGRVFNAPYTLIIQLGKLGNLLSYVLIGYFAIRRLKSGKMLLAVLLLGPTTLFMAGSFSYDPYVMACTALAFSYYFAEWQEPEKPMKWSNALIMIAALSIGCLPKAIYIFMIPMLLFLPKGKLASKRDVKIYRGIVVFAGIAVLLSFVAPFLVDMGSKTDVRGGSDVNAGAQVRYILTHPIVYTKTLLKFIANYFTPETARSYFTFLAYEGHALHFELYAWLLFIVLLSDKNAYDKYLGGHIRLRLFGHVLLFVQVAIFATCFYITFTPVGYGTINGCQPRYLLPVLFPSTYLLGSTRIQNHFNRKWYNLMIFAVCGFVAFSAVLTNVISLYH